MRFLSRQELVLQLCLAAFGIHGTAATLAFTGSLTGLTAGAPFKVTWSGAVGTSSLTLLSGTTVVNKIAFGISDQFLLWSPYAFTPAGSYVLQLDDTSGQTATSSEFSMLAAGTNPSSTPLQFTNTNFDITAGLAFNVTWTGAKGTTTLSLQQGDANSIKTADTISSDMTNEYVVWTPYATTTPGQYILRLDDTANDFAYGLVFNMQSPGSAPTSSVSPSKPTQTQAPVVQSPSTSTSRTSSNALSSTSTSKADTSQSTSTSTATPTPTPANSASTGTSTNSATSTPNTLSPNAQNNTSSPSPTGKSSLSPGAKAGIGIACSLAFIFLLTTLFLLFRQWEASRRHVQELPGTSSAGSLGYRGVAGYFGDNVVEKGSAVPPAEVRGEGRVQELDGYGGRGVV